MIAAFRSSPKAVDRVSMSLAAPSSYDKTIVDRRRPKGSVELAKVLQGARERLTARRGLLPRFDRELIIQHALAVRMAAATCRCRSS